MKKKKLLMFYAFIFTMGLTACGAAPQETPASAEEVQVQEEPVPTEEELAAEKREETLSPVLQEAAELAKSYDYEAALALLQEVPEEYAQDEEVLSAIAACTDGLDSFVPYDQPVRYIFFQDRKSVV